MWCRDHIFVLKILLQRYKVFWSRGKKYYASSVYRFWICRILIRIAMWSGISGGIWMLNKRLWSDLTCRSVTVTVGELFVTYITVMPFLSPFLSLLILGLLEDWEERGEHTFWFFTQIQRDKPSGRAPRSFHSSCYIADQQTPLSLLVESCALDGWTGVYIRNYRSLQALQRSSFALLEQLESSVPPQALPVQPACALTTAPLRAAWVVPLRCWEVEVSLSHFSRLLQQVGSAWFSYQLAHCPEKLVKSWEGMCEWFPLSVRLY